MFRISVEVAFEIFFACCVLKRVSVSKQNARPRCPILTEIYDLVFIIACPTVQLDHYSYGRHVRAYYQRNAGGLGTATP